MADKNYKIGLLFGAFDMFHVGHLGLLRSASDLCDKLIVCISSDEYISNMNGYATIIPLFQRLKIVMAIRYVDDVDVQDTKECKKRLIKKHHPNVIFVGDSRKLMFDKDTLHGVQIKYLPYERGVSLNLLRKRLKGEKR